MLKERLRVSQVAENLGVSKTIVYKRLKRFKHLLKGMIVKEKGITYITIEGLQVLKENGEVKIPKTKNDESLNTQKTFVKTEFKVLKEVLEHQVEQLEKQLFRKDQELDKRDEIINKLIDRQAESEEKLQTIIMKLTQDLEQARKMIENKTPTENKKKEESKKAEVKKTDRVVSIEQYINSKLTEEQKQRNFERLQRQIYDPLQGKSLLYKLYVKMFRPDLLRKTV